MKKVVSLLLVLVLALGMSTVAFAKATVPSKNPTDNGGAGFSGQDHLGLTVDPGDEGSFDIDSTWFNVSGHTSVVSPANTTLSKKDVRDIKLTVRAKIAKGSTALKKFEINYDGTDDAAQVYWQFVDPFKNNDPDGLDFEFILYPVVDGRAWTDDGATIEGTLKNESDEIDADTYYFNLGDNMIGECVEYAKSVEYDMGEGVSVYGRAIKGAKYWGVANKDATIKEDEMMVEKGIDEVYHLENIGLAGVASKVVLNDADPSAYVFDANFKYLGKAGDELPFSATYYLSQVMLDEDDGEEPDDDGFFDDDDIPVAPPITGGDGYPVENENDNPSTGK